MLPTVVTSARLSCTPSLKRSRPSWGSRRSSTERTSTTGDYRPGMQAASQHRVRSPLIEAGLTKGDVRALARHWGLPVWDKPATPCLSSRIAYGLEVTPERVGRVDQAERYLRQTLQLDELRVRHEANDLARIEIAASEIARLA